LSPEGPPEVKVNRHLPLLLVTTALGCGAGEASTPPDPLAARFLADPAFHWRSSHAPTLRLYAQPNSWASRHLDEITAAAGEARAHAFSLLEAPDDRSTYDLFLVEDRSEMMRLTGRRERGTTFPEERTVALIASEHWRPFLRHELMHAASIRTWGHAAAGDWVQEGVATDAEGACGRYDVDAVARFLVHAGRAITLADLTGRFREQDDLTAYMLAGSFVRHLRTRHGIGVVHAAWTGQLQRATGRTLESLYREWLEEMKSVPASVVDWDSLARNGCGWRS
ncbi:MAG TPA: hypothetical protein VF771_06185, partial [Longimicrobiaceae bacterium]